VGGTTAGPGMCVVNVYINYEKKFAFVELRTGGWRGGVVCVCGGGWVGRGERAWGRNHVQRAGWRRAAPQHGAPCSCPGLRCSPQPPVPPPLSPWSSGGGVQLHGPGRHHV
jgi:hypothetical protein